MCLVKRFLGFYTFKLWKDHHHDNQSQSWRFCFVFLISLSEGESRSVVSDSLRPPGLYSPWNSPGQNTGVGSLSLLQEIIPAQGSNPDLPHCRWILYQLRHKGSPRILEWVAYPFSSRSSQPRNRTRVSCITGELFTSWATREALMSLRQTVNAWFSFSLAILYSLISLFYGWTTNIRFLNFLSCSSCDQIQTNKNSARIFGVL